MPKILVVEDDEKLAKILKIQLEHKGFQVENAYTGLEAVEKAENSKDIDLILLDLGQGCLVLADLLLDLSRPGLGHGQLEAQDGKDQQDQGQQPVAPDPVDFPEFDLPLLQAANILVRPQRRYILLISSVVPHHCLPYPKII